MKTPALLAALLLGLGLLSCKPAAPAPGGAAASAAAGRRDYNEAAKRYREGRYAEAIPLFEDAMRRSSEAAAGAAGQDQAAAAHRLGADAAKYLAESQYEAGKRDQARRDELWRKAEPTLRARFGEAPADGRTAERRRLAVQLRDISGARGDAAAKAKYEGVVKEIDGRVAKDSYNEAVALYQAKKYREAEPLLKKAVEADGSLSQAHFLLGYCESRLGKKADARASLRKYLELAPGGQHAKDARELLETLK
jgi:TolA-binding protein